MARPRYASTRRPRLSGRLYAGVVFSVVVIYASLWGGAVAGAPGLLLGLTAGFAALVLVGELLPGSRSAEAERLTKTPSWTSRRWARLAFAPMPFLVVLALSLI